MSYNIFRNFGYLLEPVSSDLVETEKHANGFVAYCISPSSRTRLLLAKLPMKILLSPSFQDKSQLPSWNESMEWIQSPPRLTTGTLKQSTSRHNGTELMPLPARNHTTHTQYKKITLNRPQKLLHMLWMLTQSNLRNSLVQKGKDASKKDNAFNAENLDISWKTTNFSEKTFPPRKPQEKPKPKRVAIVEEDEEELKQLAEEEREEELMIGKVVIQDFWKGDLPWCKSLPRKQKMYRRRNQL